MVEPDDHGISARLWRHPGQLLLALINATAILVIVAAIVALVAIAQINRFAENVAATMTEAVLSKVDLPQKDVLANIRNLTTEVSTLGNTLREIKAGEHPALQPELGPTQGGPDRSEGQRRPAWQARVDPHRRSDRAIGPDGHRRSDEAEGLLFSARQVLDHSSRRSFALRPVAAPWSDRRRASDPTGRSLPHGFVLACSFRNAFSPASDTSTHFLSGAASAT